MRTVSLTDEELDALEELLDGAVDHAAEIIADNISFYKEEPPESPREAEIREWEMEKDKKFWENLRSACQKLFNYDIGMWETLG
jgi:hypothetical protein